MIFLNNWFKLVKKSFASLKPSRRQVSRHTTNSYVAVRQPCTTHLFKKVKDFFSFTERVYKKGLNVPKSSPYAPIPTRWLAIRLSSTIRTRQMPSLFTHLVTQQFFNSERPSLDSYSWQRGNPYGPCTESTAWQSGFRQFSPHNDAGSQCAAPARKQFPRQSARPAATRREYSGAEAPC